jgi:putative flippase GtrA
MSIVRRLHKLVAAPVESTLLQVPRALIVSVLALVVDAGLYALLIEQLGAPPVAANVFSYLAGGVVQYVLCTLWVFPASPGNHAVGFVTFSVLSLVGLGLSCAVIYTMHDLGHINEMVAKFASVGIAFTWNFLSRKFLLFKPTAAGQTIDTGGAEAEAAYGADAMAAPTV